MKKLIPLLLSVAISANADFSFEWGKEKIKIAPPIITSCYDLDSSMSKRNIGDKMPRDYLNEIERIPIYKLNLRTNKRTQIGMVYGFDINCDGNVDYHILTQDCEGHGNLNPYAIVDYKNSLIYIDSSRNRKIDKILEKTLDDLINVRLPFFPIKCKRRLK